MIDKNVTDFNGTCHCGAVQFSVKLSNGLHTARRCTCSYCTMRGAVAVSAKLSDLTIIAGADMLNTYRFGTMTAAHHFCSVCGIYTHHKRRSNPGEYGVNVACLDGVSPFDFEEVPVKDGVNHPSDSNSATREAGVLRCIPVE